MISGIMRAARYAARGLGRSPQFTLAAVVTLALAIGTNASIFSVVQGVLLKPLRYHDADRLVMLRHSAPGLGYDDFGISPGLFQLYRGGGAFESSGIYAEADVNVTGDASAPARLSALRASREVFATLGVTPEVGRVFDEAEDRPGGPAVVLLSYGLWQERFAGGSVVGRSMQIDGEAHTVVGVMPESFEFPTRDTRLWLPLALDTTEQSYGEFTYQAVARLRDGIDAEQATAGLRPLLERLRQDGAEAGDFTAFMDAGRLAAVVSPMKELVVGDVSRALWILLGTVGFVFLIACANVTNLFLVRAEARQKEMAVRAALGAGRSGLIGHYAAESLLIAGAGGLLGLALTWAALRALLAIAPPNIPRLHEVSIDPVVLVFTLLATALAAVLLGLLPTLRLTSPDVLATVSRSGRGSAGRERNRVRKTLVVAQTALALVLLIGSGLMVRSFDNMSELEPGFDPANALTFRLSLPAATYPDGARITQFHTDLLERLRGIPGVEQAGATSHPPLAGCCAGTAHLIEDQPVEPGQMPPMFWYSSVSDGYFATMGIPIIAGREFDSFDRDTSRHNIIISEAIATALWPDQEAVGRRIRPSSAPDWFTVVGVAGSVRDRALELEPSQMVYYPIAAGAAGQPQSMTYVIRASRPDAIAPLARAQVWAIDPNLPIAATATYDEIVADSMVRMNFTMLALVAASAIALILGAIGLYSVISYIVTQRTNEIGIRLALGAQPSEVRRMVVLQGARLAALGLVIGFFVAIALTRLMEGMLFGTEPHDPLTFAAVTAALAAIALVATYVPALRASRIDPASSLKLD